MLTTAVNILPTHYKTRLTRHFTRLYASFRYFTSVPRICHNKLLYATFFSLILVLACSCTAKYKWTAADYTLAIAMITAQVGDGYTTDRIVNDHNGHEKWSPWLYGKHPSTERIITTKAVETTIILGAAHIAPVIHPKLRKFVLGISTATAGYATYHNYNHLKDLD